MMQDIFSNQKAYRPARDVYKRQYEEFCQHTPAENMVEHDAVEIYDFSVKMCKNVIEKKGISAENIIGIGITNQRNTAVI